jgi:hypothetical protein
MRPTAAVYPCFTRRCRRAPRRARGSPDHALAGGIVAGTAMTFDPFLREPSLTLKAAG